MPLRNSHSWWRSHSCRLLGRSLKWRREPSLGSFTIIIMLTKTCWWWSNWVEKNNVSLFPHGCHKLGSSIFCVLWEINFRSEFYSDLLGLINVAFYPTCGSWNSKIDLHEINRISFELHAKNYQKIQRENL